MLAYLLYAGAAQVEGRTGHAHGAQRSRLWFREGSRLHGGGSMADFDAMAKALNLTPTQLFEQLHSGKTLAEIAQAQGVDLTKIQEAANATRIQAQKDRIAQAVTDGTMTQAQADWLIQGLEKGYMGKGMGGFDGGHMGPW